MELYQYACAAKSTAEPLNNGQFLLCNWGPVQRGSTTVDRAGNEGYNELSYSGIRGIAVSYTHLTLPTTPYV